MDSDLLRIVLIALGATVVLAIYLWDKFKRSRTRFARVTEEDERTEPRVADFDEHTWDTSGIDDAMPPMDEGNDEEHDALPNIIEKAVAKQQKEPPAKNKKAAPLELNEWDAVDHETEPQYTLDLNFNAQGDSDHVKLDPDLYGEVPRKIIQINLVAKQHPFSGTALFKAAKEVEMEYGEMDIFHRIDSAAGGKVIFSMVNMVEPGSFPDDPKLQARFASPGVTLFTQLPAVRDGLAVYSDMLFTAERLAALLHAELEDESHCVLTKQSIEHTRETILEHKRQIQLIRSRRK